MQDSSYQPRTITKPYRNPLVPWFTVWVLPKKTIRKIIQVNPKYQVLLLGALFGITKVVNQIVNDQIDYSVMTMVPLFFFFAILIGALIGLIWLFFGAAINFKIVEGMGGVGTQEDTRAAFAWGYVPNIASFFLVAIPLTILFQNVQISPNYFLNLMINYLLVGLGIFGTILNIWSIGITVAALSEIHRLSAFRAFASLAIPILTLAALFYLIGLFFERLIQIIMF